MSYAGKEIAVTFALSDGTFNGIDDTVTLTGLRVKAQVAAYGNESNPKLTCQIYGLPLSMMNRLTRISAPGSVGQNSIELAAGDTGSALTTIFTGIIVWAWADMQGAPDSCLYVEAYTGALAALKPVGASSFVGSVNVAFIMQGLAKLAGFGFENNGVNVKLNSPYFPGTALRQIQSCAKAAGINYVIDKDVLAIWPMYGSRATPNPPLLSVETGMSGYPIYQANQIEAVSEFNPLLNIGTQVRVESILAPASKLWNVFSFEHEIESQTPGGAWFTHVSGLSAS